MCSGVAVLVYPAAAAVVATCMVVVVVVMVMLVASMAPVPLVVLVSFHNLDVLLCRWWQHDMAQSVEHA